MKNSEKNQEKLKEFKKKGRGFFGEFKEFINRGSVMDLAVGVIIGGAFTSIVTSLVNDIIMPLIGLVAGGVNFSNLSFKIDNFFDTGDQAIIAYGNFLQNVANFLLVALCVFLVVKGMNRMRERAEKLRKKEEKKEEQKEVNETLVLLREIRDSLKTK